MGLLSFLERLMFKSEQQKQVDMKEIVCKKTGKDYIKQFRTSVSGCEYKNVDGSDRQEALANLKVGKKVRLIWDAGGDGKAKKIYVVRSRGVNQLAMPDCFGRLNDKVAADVIRWLNKDDIVTSAKIVDIVGGTRKRPKLGCVLELTTYHRPEKDKKKKA